jgi:drug/metabolite transporter (DMT)-like permease
MIAQPILTAMLAIPFLGEKLYVWQWIGGISVLSGIILVNNGRAKIEGVKDATRIQT